MIASVMIAAMDSIASRQCQRVLSVTTSSPQFGSIGFSPFDSCPFAYTHDPTLELAPWCVAVLYFHWAALSAPADPAKALQDEALGWGIAAGVCYFAYKLVFGECTGCPAARNATPDGSTLDRSPALLCNRR